MKIYEGGAKETEFLKPLQEISKGQSTLRTTSLSKYLALSI